jgi:sulfur carrier protein ThiS
MILVKVAAARDWTKVEFKEGMRVKDILEKLNYHPASVALTSLNGVAADENDSLKDGDEIIVVPTVGGG